MGIQLNKISSVTMGTYEVLRLGGEPVWRACVALDLPDEFAVRFERRLQTRRGDGTDSQQPRFARHADHVAAVIAEGGYGGLSIKDYVAATAWSYNAGALPAQAGNAGKFVKTDGVTASWQSIASPDLTDYPALIGRAVALAVAL